MLQVNPNGGGRVLGKTRALWFGASSLLADLS
jgi:hypothetical protein